MAPSTKTILFLGATGGTGLAALRKALAAGSTCVALCRTPSKLARLLIPSLPTNVADEELVKQVQKKFPNLRIEQGNARDVATVARCLVAPSDNRPVDIVLSSIGHPPSLSSKDDWHVCEAGMETLITAVKEVRKAHPGWTPRVISVSTTGISDQGRDVPILFAPLYHVALKTPHVDKRLMEKALVAAAKEGVVRFTIVRASFLTSGKESSSTIRVGVEDPVAGKRESSAIGYTISRDDVGKWISENILQETDDKWVGKIATITY